MLIYEIVYWIIICYVVGFTSMFGLIWIIDNVEKFFRRKNND